MSLIFPILGTLALAGAFLFTMGLSAATGLFTMRKPSGPDAMGLASLFFASIGAWGLIAVAAAIAAGRGSFGWAIDSPGAATMLALLFVAGLAGVSIVGAGASLETSLALRTPIGLAAGLALPAIVIIFIGALLWLPAPQVTVALWPRLITTPLALLSAAAWVAGGVMYVRQVQANERARIEREAERERDRLRYAEESRQRDAGHAAQLAAMPDDAPLAEFLTHLFIDKSEEHHARALKRIGALPDLRHRIEVLLADPVPIQREYCANYIRMCAEPDPGLAPAVGNAIILLAEDIERAAPAGELSHVKGMTQGIFMTAQKFPGVRFDSEAARLHAALERWPHEETRDGAIAIVDRYLKGEPVEMSN